MKRIIFDILTVLVIAGVVATGILGYSEQQRNRVLQGELLRQATGFQYEYYRGAWDVCLYLMQSQIPCRAMQDGIRGNGWYEQPSPDYRP